jgi:hypothetical protein
VAAWRATARHNLVLAGKLCLLIEGVVYDFAMQIVHEWPRQTHSIGLNSGQFGRIAVRMSYPPDQDYH